jgi:hypothetical protein
LLYPNVIITKLHAARSQLRTAIELWFAGGDSVSIHALAFAAYEIIHTLNKLKGRGELIFDSKSVKEEHRQEAAEALKKAALFFKHARKDPEGSIEFQPRLSETFILFSITGLRNIGAIHSGIEGAFMAWQSIHRPAWFLKGAFKDGVPVDKKDVIRSFSKSQFLKGFLDARREAGLGD